MLVFTYAYYSKKSDADTEQFKRSTQKLRDSITTMSNRIDDAGYFSLEKNENAKEYLEIADATEIISKITNQVLDLNENPAGNPLIPYGQINGQKFLVNKVKVLNHRWVIADFSDGIIWGELLLKYFVEEDGSITFERIDSQLYPASAQ